VVSVREMVGGFRQVFQLLRGLRHVGVATVGVGLFLAVCAGLISYDMVALYEDLKPWETYWSSMTALDKIRFASLFVFVPAALWYLIGAARQLTRKSVLSF